MCVLWGVGSVAVSLQVFPLRRKLPGTATQKIRNGQKRMNDIKMIKHYSMPKSGLSCLSICDAYLKTSCFNLKFKVSVEKPADIGSVSTGWHQVLVLRD